MKNDVDAHEKRHGYTRAGRNRLIDRGSLDGRTAIAKAFDALVSAYHAHLGGRDEISVIEAGMAESFAGTRLMINQLITELLAGAPIDEAMVSKYTALASTEIRQASRLGLRPRQKLIGPTLGEILAEGHAWQQRGRE